MSNDRQPPISPAPDTPRAPVVDEIAAEFVAAVGHGNAGDRPTILWEEHRLPEILKQVDAVLADSARNAAPGGVAVFQSGGALRRPLRIISSSIRDLAIASGTLGIRQVGVDELRVILTDVISWLRFDRRSARELEIACPEIVARAFLASPAFWTMPPLRAVLEAPTITLYGRIVQKPGYDADTRLFFDPGATKFPVIEPGRVSQKDLAAARARFAEILVDFPFVEESDFSVALAAILTAIMRPCLPTAPAFGISAPASGTGKTLLSNLVPMIATGRTAAVMQHAVDPAEESKLLLAVLAEGISNLLIDNAENLVRSPIMCSLLTSETFRGRPLGQTATITVPTAATILINGKNLRLGGDLTTRVLVCRLDARMESPEQRVFETNLYDRVSTDRPALVAGALTILQGFMASGVDPRSLVPQWGRFETWSDTVRAAIVWLGFPDPCSALKRLELEDPDRLELDAVLTAWQRLFADQPVFVSALIDAATTGANHDLQVALDAVAGKHGAINARSLGWWLARHESRLIDGRSVVRAGRRAGQSLWRVVEKS